jgi:hypothetical protein
MPTDLAQSLRKVDFSIASTWCRVDLAWHSHIFAIQKLINSEHFPSPCAKNQLLNLYAVA